MEFSISQELSQRQQLSAQMLHSLTILRMNAKELREYIEALALENPVVEVISEPAEGDAHIPNAWRIRSELSQLDTAVQHKGQTLREDLEFQLMGLPLSPQHKAAVSLLIHCLDESGYLRAELEEIADPTHPLPLLKEALHQLQKMEPVGVGARSLSECLELQLRTFPDSDIAIRLVRDHLPELAKNRLSQLAKQLDCTIQDIRHAESLIRRCTPKPGNGYAPEGLTEYVIPDLYIFENEEHQLQIVPDSTACPYIKINADYQTMVGEDIDAEASKYLQERISQASSAISYIAKRNLTLLQCAQILTREQALFFRKGPKLLRPLGLKEIAEQMQVSESTVSRTLQGKYFRCIWGVFPLKYLAQRGFLASTDGSELNAKAICAAIEDLIARENKKKPLSDQAISEGLAAAGIVISRRTIAKYREQCGIGTASQRRLK